MHRPVLIAHDDMPLESSLNAAVTTRCPATQTTQVALPGRPCTRWHAHKRRRELLLGMCCDCHSVR